MPTGYTDDIYSGKEITFKEFLFKCSRAFGALIELRDEPLSSDIPDEVVPYSYHKDALLKLYQEKEEIESWSKIESDFKSIDWFNGEVRRLKEYIKEKQELKERYEDMLFNVQKWNPPTPDHVGLKKFMIQQLEESIKFDAGTEYWENQLKTVYKPNGDEYKTKELNKVNKEIKYHKEENEKEINRAKEKTAWIVALKESVE